MTEFSSKIVSSSVRFSWQKMINYCWKVFTIMIPFYRQSFHGCHRFNPLKRFFGNNKTNKRKQQRQKIKLKFKTYPLHLIHLIHSVLNLTTFWLIEIHIRMCIRHVKQGNPWSKSQTYKCTRIKLKYKWTWEEPKY